MEPIKRAEYAEAAPVRAMRDDEAIAMQAHRQFCEDGDALRDATATADQTQTQPGFRNNGDTWLTWLTKHESESSHSRRRDEELEKLSGAWYGVYREYGNMREYSQYTLQVVRSDGNSDSITGTGRDRDGAFVVSGLFNTKTRRLAWGERTKKYKLYARCRLACSNADCTRLTGEFLASTGIGGELTLQKLPKDMTFKGMTGGAASQQRREALAGFYKTCEQMEYLRHLRFKKIAALEDEDFYEADEVQGMIEDMEKTLRLSPEQLLWLTAGVRRVEESEERGGKIAAE